MNITSDWIRQVELGKQPSKGALQRHLNEVHGKNPGFTDTIASNCRDIYGNSSYDLLLDFLDKYNDHIKIDKYYLEYEPIYQLYYSLLNVYLWDRSYIEDVRKLLERIKI